MTLSDYWGRMSQYPSYCAGLAYMMRPSLVAKLLAASQFLPLFWIDDVYVTGLLVASVQARHFSLNLRYTHKQVHCPSCLISWVLVNDLFRYSLHSIDVMIKTWYLATASWDAEYQCFGIFLLVVHCQLTIGYRKVIAVIELNRYQLFQISCYD